VVRKKDELKFELKEMFFILALLILLFIASQFTRFENKLTINYNGNNFTLQVQDAKLSISQPGLSFKKITATFQKATLSESGLSFLRIEDANNKPVYELKRSVIYLFGKDVLNNMIKGNYGSNFKKSFGDWSGDRHFSEEVLLYNNTLPSKFQIHANIVGRGSNNLNFYADNGTQIASVSIVDGFYDNDFSICAGSCVTEYNKKNILINISRIINFFIESTFFATLFVFVISVLSNNNIFRGRIQ